MQRRGSTACFPRNIEQKQLILLPRQEKGVAFTPNQVAEDVSQIHLPTTGRSASEASWGISTEGFPPARKATLLDRFPHRP